MTGAERLAMVGELLDEALAGLRVGVTAIHETVDIGVFHTIFVSDVYQLEQVFER